MILLQKTLKEWLTLLFSLSELSLRQKWVLGLFNLALVVVLWVLSSFLVSGLFEQDTWRKPFFMTYLNTGCFMFYLIPYLISERQTLREFVDAVMLDFHQSKLGLSIYHSMSSDDYGSANISEDEEFIGDVQPSSHESNNIVGLYETIKLSSQFAVIWFTANLVTNASLSYTSVASQTILSTTSSFFTLVVGFLCLVEKINLKKLGGLVLSFMGVVLVTEIDTNDPPESNTPGRVIFGNLLALSGALLYGIYTTLLKKKVMITNSNRERDLNAHLFFAFVGIFALVSLFPVLLVLHFTGYETIEAPPTSYALGLFLINIVTTFVSDLCWCKAVLLTSPLTVTVGLSMTIPLAMVGDWVIKGFLINLLYMLGAGVVIVGFLIINRDEEEDFVEHRVE